MKFKQSVIGHSHDGRQCDAGTGRLRQPIDRERQHVGALRIADQQHALLAEMRKIVANHAVGVAATPFGVRAVQ